MEVILHHVKNYADSPPKQCILHLLGAHFASRMFRCTHTSALEKPHITLMLPLSMPNIGQRGTAPCIGLWSSRTVFSVKEVHPTHLGLALVEFVI